MNDTPVPPERLSPELRKQYRQSIYRFRFEDRRIEMRVDEPSPALRQVHTARDVRSSAFMTAWNPRSKPLERDENDARNEALRADLRRLGHAWLEGDGVAPDSDWEEASLLILGIARPAARELARKYGQNAFLFAAEDGVPRLVFTADDED